MWFHELTSSPLLLMLAGSIELIRFNFVMHQIFYSGGREDGICRLFHGDCQPLVEEGFPFFRLVKCEGQMNTYLTLWGYCSTTASVMYCGV